MEFRAFPHLAKTSVIAVLLAAPCVASRCLDVTDRLQTNPHIRPGRRYDKGFDALQGNSFANPRPVRVCISKPFAGPVASDTRPLIADVDKTGVFRRLFGVDDGFARWKIEGQLAISVIKT